MSVKRRWFLLVYLRKSESLCAIYCCILVPCIPSYFAQYAGPPGLKSVFFLPWDVIKVACVNTADWLASVATCSPVPAFPYGPRLECHIHKLLPRRGIVPCFLGRATGPSEVWQTTRTLCTFSGLICLSLITNWFWGPTTGQFSSFKSPRST